MKTKYALLLVLATPLFTSLALAQQNVPPPPKPADSGPSLVETMKFIQEKFGSQGVISWTNRYPDGSIQHVEHESKEVSADPDTCTLKFRWVENSASDALKEDALEVASMRDVEKIMVETIDTAANRLADRAGFQGYRSTATPPVFSVTLVAAKKVFKFRDADTGTERLWEEMSLYFGDEDLANRVAKALVHAVELCTEDKKPEAF